MMNNAKIWARIAAGLLIFHLIGHQFGHFAWKDNGGDSVKAEVIRQMTGPRFEFMGASRSMGDYYEGYGHLISVALVLLALVLWFLGSMLQQGNAEARKMGLAIGAGLLLFAGVEFAYFFPFAAVITGLAAVASLWAGVKARAKTTSPNNLPPSPSE